MLCAPEASLERHLRREIDDNHQQAETCNGLRFQVWLDEEEVVQGSLIGFEGFEQCIIAQWRAGHALAAFLAQHELLDVGFAKPIQGLPVDL